MFRIADPEKAGRYLSELIVSKYENQRKFCIKWLEIENKDITNEEIQRKTNKLSQIKNGNNRIQTKDLPALCSALGVSCEEILSGGENIKPSSFRLTNYKTAMSDDKSIWEEYIEQTDETFYNADEYGKTIIDYAIEFNNVELIKYLFDCNLIQLECDYNSGYGFEAVTDISAEEYIINSDYSLQMKLQSHDMRIGIIPLAIENNDDNLLNELNARNMNFYYDKLFTSYGREGIYKKGNDFIENNDKYDFSDKICKASDAIVKYYTDTTCVKHEYTGRNGNIISENELKYFYISELLDSLIIEKHEYTEAALLKALEYNKKTYNYANDIMKKIKGEALRKADEMASYMSWNNENDNKEDYIKSISREMYEDRFYTVFDGRFIKIEDENISDQKVRNLIQINERPQNQDINLLVNEINDYYHKITGIYEEIMD